MSATPDPGRRLDYSIPPELRQDAVVFRESRMYLALLMVVAILCLGAGLAAMYGLILSRQYGRLLTFVGIIGIVGVVRRMLRVKPRMIVDANGITDDHTGLGLIPWEQIIGVRVVKDAWRPFLCLTVREPQRIRDKRGMFNIRDRGAIAMPMGAGPSDVTIPISGMTSKAEQVVATIERFRQEAGSRTPLP